MKAKIEAIEQQVMSTLRLSVEDVFELKLTEGLDFLQYIHPADIRQALRDSEVFWTWWRGLWANRDKKLLNLIDVELNGFSYNCPVPCKEKNWLACREIDWCDGFQFYKGYHTNQIEMIHQYPNEEVIKAAMRQQYDKKQTVNA